MPAVFNTDECKWQKKADFREVSFYGLQTVSEPNKIVTSCNI